MKRITLLTVCCASIFAGENLRAQLTNSMTFTLTFLYQNFTNLDNGKVTTIPAPIKSSITTKGFLNTLAQDENAAGNYPSNTFPSGAKLVLVNNNFQVLDQNNNFLLDVSNLLTFSPSSNKVVSGKLNDNNGLPDPTTITRKLVTFQYDDTGITTVSLNHDTVQFQLTGFDTKTITNTIPSGGFYRQTQSQKITSVIGEGTIIYMNTLTTTTNLDFVVTGTITAFGKGTLAVP